MKYQLETIPVTDMWASGTFCPLCSLMDNAEKRHIQYYLGNSVMNPETRLKVNDTGFCPRHFPMMTQAGAAHHLGLLGHTHLQEVCRKLGPSLKLLREHPSGKHARLFQTRIEKLTGGCLVCQALEQDARRYLYTAVVLFSREEEFRRLFEQSEGPCLPHASALAGMAAEVLKKPELTVFLSALVEHLSHSLEETEADILHFTRKFDAQNDGLDWGKARDAHFRTVQLLSGKTVQEQ